MTSKKHRFSNHLQLEPASALASVNIKLYYSVEMQRDGHMKRNVFSFGLLFCVRLDDSAKSINYII